MAEDYRDLHDRGFGEQRLRERRELEAQDAEFARVKRQRQREEQREQYSAVDVLRAELDALRQECDQRYNVQMAAIGRVLDEVIDDMRDAIKKVEHELFILVEKRFTELQTRLDVIMPERPRPKDFKFAGERDDGPADLPNPLTPRRRWDS
jgi:hypothetical protein